MREIRTLEDFADQELARELFDEIWPSESGGTQINANFLIALTHGGSYLAGVFDPKASGEKLVAAAFAFPAIDESGRLFLHSHMAAVRPGLRNQGLGTALKEHQRQWALSRKFEYIGWTFDPLVARNAKLNIEKLGAEVSEYLVDFYGAMSDSINSGDATDRLFVRWWLKDQNAKDIADQEYSDEEVLVEIPEDIISLRKSDMASAKRWRIKVREELEPRLRDGFKILGFTEERQYRLKKPVGERA